MAKHYIETVDNITFNGTYEIEEDDEGFSPIFSLCTIKIAKGHDLMLVIDPRVVQEIETNLLVDWLYNELV